LNYSILSYKKLIFIFNINILAIMLAKIDPKNVINSSLWKPWDIAFNYVINTNSWFDIKAMKLPNDDYINLEKISNIRTKPIIIKPNTLQRSILLEWNEVYRQVYNITVAYFKTNKVTSFITARKIIDAKIAENKVLTKLSDDYKIPKHTRDNAIKDCIKAYKTAFANIKAKNIKFFKIRYKKKSHHLSSIVIEPAAFSKVKNAFAIKALGNIESSEPLTGIDKECRLCYNSRTGKFVLRVPYDKIVENKVSYNRSTCSMDPGMRTFQTIYTKDGNCFEIATTDVNRQIYKLIKKINNPYTENPKHKKYLNRLREKLTNKIKDMHYKTCKFLCKSFDTIVIGNMSTRSIVSNKKNLRPVVKQYCYALSHYLFKERLQNKAEEYNCKVLVVDESYTSKTCGGCGLINDKLGSSKMFRCKVCNFTCDRDINGARNILIKSKI